MNSASAVTITSASTTYNTSAGSTSIASGSGGLSSGALAGIGIGSALGALLLAIGGWFLYRRKSKKKRGGEADYTAAHELPMKQQLESELTRSDLGYTPARLAELHEQGMHNGHELDSTNRPAELA